MTGILSIQFKPKVGEKEKNLQKIYNFLKENSQKKLDLVLVPEFFSTGISHQSFENEPEDENGGEIIEYMKNLAIEFNTNIICGTVIEKVNDKYYNTSFAINRKGEIIGKYRKIHLYNYMGGNEGGLITSGDKEVVVDFDFGKVGMAICFDIRYPQLIKKLAKMGAELVVLPTAWVVPCDVYENEETKKYARDMWIAMNRTRAYDNMIYLVISDLVGKCNEFQSAIGSSMIISPLAEVIADAKFNECAIYADIDPEIVKYLKSQYPIANID